jgi:hypothetical protein
MADILKFESDDFEVLETFDHEEEIRRPEELRFYTLDEQLNDFFEKLLPSKLSRTEEKELKKLRDRVRLSYENTIVVTDTDYAIQRKFRPSILPWIFPVYSGFEYNEYSFKKDWDPLFSKEQRAVPNYYPRLIGALPKPYKNTGEGRPGFGTLKNKDGEDPITVLGKYKSTRTVVNDDGTLGIETQEYSVEDSVNVQGYYLEERPYEIPRSMDHPFLKSRKPVYIESTVALQDAFPSLETIMDHAIPTTHDPYHEGKKHLDVYGVRLEQIPWLPWKERFPPAEYKDIPIPRQEIPLEKEENEKPSDLLMKYYSGWYSGYDPRFWIMNQIDSGHLVSRLLLSEANSTGTLNVYPVTPITYTFPEAFPETCQKLTESFDSFLESGLYRPVKGGQCIPITTILQEKSNLLYGGTVWKETTPTEILSYSKLFGRFIQQEQAVEKYQRFELKKDSERRTDVLAILKDTREDEDKAEAVERLTRDLELKDRLFYDAEGFVLCSHTLELLRGALKERFKFYSEWTTTVEGSRVCKFCGEEINSDNFIAVKEYDTDGHIVMEYEPLSAELQTIVSLNSLKSLFDQENGGESLLYIVLSYLQILPSEQQLIPILQLIRSYSKGLSARAKQTGRISRDDIQYTEGLFGIAGAVVLLQTHNPFLIPKRKIGPKVFDSTGYPRDSEDPETCRTMKSIFQLLQFVLKSFPLLYKGGVAIVLRKLLKDPEEVKPTALKFIGLFYDKFKSLFESASERYIEPKKEETKNQFTLPLKVIKISPERENVECKQFQTGTVIKMRRGVTYPKPIPLDTKYPSPDNKLITTEYNPPKMREVSKAEIRKKIDLGLSGFPFGEFIKTADGPAYIGLTIQLLSLLRNSSFPLKDQQYFRSQLSFKVESDSLFRDTAKGIFFEFLAKVKTSPPLTRLITNALKTDLTLKLFLIDKKEAELEELELRAKERNYVKAALRKKNDAEREIYQQLLSLGISEFLVTIQDREKFFQDYSAMDEFPEDEPDTLMRDYVENGNLPVADTGQEMEVDYGDYGDRAVRDYNDYTVQEFSDDLD